MPRAEHCHKKSPPTNMGLVDWMKKFNIFCLVIAMLLLLCIIYKQPRHGQIVSREIADGPCRTYATYFTWSGFDGLEEIDPQKANYIVDGVSVGCGKQGFEQVLDKLNGLPNGSAILMFPSYDTKEERSFDRPRFYPWSDEAKKLFALMDKKRFVLVFSPYDSSGSLCKGIPTTESSGTRP